MRNTGRLLLFLAWMMIAPAGLAAVTAEIDRQTVALGDTLRLAITATEEEEINDTDLRPLLVDFEILQRSTSSNTSIVNGRRTHSKQILLDITPRRQGALEIPPVRVGRDYSNSLTVNVGPPESVGSAGETVLFEAEVDRQSVYVQGQVILTLRIQQAINLDNRGISELKLEDAFVKQLEQKSFQRSIDGRPWLVHEVRYAIFPAYSGKLEIPTQTFTGRESRGRRSFFDLNSGGQLIRRSSDPISVEVLPRPASFGGNTWLPARLVSIEESWSTPPNQLRAGESTTRTITIRGEGLQGAQLPPVIFEPVEGLKYYPDQPVIGENEIDSGLIGSRQDSAALVPTRAGSWKIPEIRIPWWDTESQRVRYAEIPGRSIEVLPADTASTRAQASPLEHRAVETTASVTNDTQTDRYKLVWQAIAVLSSLGWAFTLYLLWRNPSRKPVSRDNKRGDPNEARSFKQLIAACTAGNAEQARKAIIQWAAAQLPEATIFSLDQVNSAFGDVTLGAELARLNRHLFSQPGTTWDGSELAACARRLRSEHSTSRAGSTPSLELYPA